MIRRIRTIDAHAAGEPLRLIVEGFPSVAGGSMLERREWLRTHHDDLRRALMFEPRGHADMYGALLTDTDTPGADAGVLFMHNEGYSTMCGHGIIAVTKIALERGLVMPRNGPGGIVLDSPAGPIRATATLDAAGRIVTGVAFLNVPSFVLHAGLQVRLGTRTVRADVAFGGAWYAIVDSEAAGIPIDRGRLTELRRAGMEIKDSVDRTHTVTHPLEPGLTGLYGTIFTGPATHPDAHLRNVTIFADAQVDRSPCGTGTAAVMAVLHAMGLLVEDHPFVPESIVGTMFSGRIAERVQVGDYAGIVPEITGSAWITGEHTFLIDDEDPLGPGFRLG